MAVDFNNIGVALHRLQRYEEAEEMFRGAVQLLLRSKGSCMLANPSNLMYHHHHENSQPELFDAMFHDDDQIRSAASKMEDKALSVNDVVPSAENHDVNVDQVTMTTESTPCDTPVQQGTADVTIPPSNTSSPFISSPSSLSQAPHHLHQDFSTAHNIPQGMATPRGEDIVHRQSQWDPSTSPMSSLEESSSIRSFKTHSPPRPRDESSVYMCLDAIQLDASTTRSPALAEAVNRTTSSLRQDHHHLYDDDDMSDNMLEDNVATATNPNNENAIGRYDFETIVVLYNMALTLHCLGQLPLSCYIYDLADRVLRGQSMDRVHNDKVVSHLALAISNNLGQILLKLGHWDIARSYVYRLADYLLSMDPPATSDQAKERLEFILNIYWFDHPPSASAA